MLLSFSTLQTGDQVMTAKGNRTLAILNGKEDYSSLKKSFGSIFSEINSMITEAKITVGDTEVETDFFLGGDYKFILVMLGLNGATANYACAWCKIHKDDRWKTDQHFSYFNSEPLSRSLPEMKKMSKISKDNYGCCKEPLLDIELDHIIVDELHLLLRITDVLTSNLITEVIEWDIEENLESTSNKQVHLNKLINSIRSCGVSFDVWKKKNADGKESSIYDWTSLMGNDKKILLYHLPEKMHDFLRSETVDKVIKIWVDFAALYKNLSDWQPHTSPTEFWLKAKQWVNDFVSLTRLREGYERKRVTPYMHIMVAHIPWFFKMYKAVKIFTGQGVERNNDVARSTVLRKSNKWDSVGDVLRQESRQWQLRNREREPRSYRKHKTEYWEEDIFKKRQKSTPPEATTQPLSHLQSDQSAVTSQTHSAVPLSSVEFTKMTVPQLKQELKKRGIKGIAKKTKHQLVQLLKGITDKQNQSATN